MGLLFCTIGSLTAGPRLLLLKETFRNWPGVADNRDFVNDTSQYTDTQAYGSPEGTITGVSEPSLGGTDCLPLA